MPREEIQSGLKNAVERGESLESAAQSFINAGYNPSEVRQAAQYISSGASDIISQSSSNFSESQESNQAPRNQNSQNNYYQKKKFPWLAITLTSILVLLVIGLIITLLFKEEILSLFS